MTTRHPYFDLALHTDSELAAALGSEVVARETLAEWPLSCVQRIRTADGRTRIYKAQAEPTVEPQFYVMARSPALVAATALPNPSCPAALLLEDVTGPRLCDLDLAPKDAPRIAEAVLHAISGIRGDFSVAHGLPALADLTTPAGYVDYVESMLADLSALVQSGAFVRVTEQSVATIARAATRITSPISELAYLHGDLTAENVFVSDWPPDRGALIIIDWQRPLRGPVDLDRACLLESLGVNPLPIVGPEIMALLAITRIAWFAACARRWFPPGMSTYDTQVAVLAASLDVG